MKLKVLLMFSLLFNVFVRNRLAILKANHVHMYTSGELKHLESSFTNKNQLKASWVEMCTFNS